MATQQVAANGSEQVVGNTATSTGTSGGSAGNNTTTVAAGATQTSTPVVAPKGFRSELQLMLQGWQELIPSDSTLMSAGSSLSEAAVLAQLQGYLGAYTALDTSATAGKQARNQVASQLAEARKYYAALKAAVTTYFGAESPQLVKFGLKPKKVRAPLTTEQLSVRTAKARATRKLRGTKGSVQKAAIKAGPMTYVDPVETTVPAPSATPVVSAASPPAGK
jgi:hypothetical protein